MKQVYLSILPLATSSEHFSELIDHCLATFDASKHEEATNKQSVREAATQMITTSDWMVGDEEPWWKDGLNLQKRIEDAQREESIRRRQR